MKSGNYTKNEIEGSEYFAKNTENEDDILAFDDGPLDESKRSSVGGTSTHVGRMSEHSIKNQIEIKLDDIDENAFEFPDKQKEMEKAERRASKKLLASLDKDMN